MKRYFAYTRVSTTRQGEKGSSLQEQKAAIEAYARRYSLSIVEWFEEQETAAKHGRPVFTRMLSAINRGSAHGVITHKIDRSARNLRDWAALGELVDGGIELHFAHESIDLTSRGGRLAADIQAVVAADFIRNLKDEVRKGFYGRLKQGLYPMKAPLGYLDQGGGRAKVIDPVHGPTIRAAFDLYASGEWNLRTLSEELFARGVRTRAGCRLHRSALSHVLNNPFYVGLIRIKKTRETYLGVHEPLVDKAVFDRVQVLLRGRTNLKLEAHRFRYQRLLRCTSCGRSLSAELQKGHVYYRCHTPSCPTISFREEAVDATLRTLSPRFRPDAAIWAAMESDVEEFFADSRGRVGEELRSVAVRTSALDDRLARLTDAYLDRVVDRETYVLRKDQLLGERASLASRRTVLEGTDDPTRRRIKDIFELVKSLGYMPDLGNDARLRRLLKDATSNLSASENNIAVTWAFPLNRLFSDEDVQSGPPCCARPRTFRERMLQLVKEYADGSDGGPQREAAGG